MKAGSLLLFISVLLAVKACSGKPDIDYSFDGKPSEEVLNNYLDRAITMQDLLSARYPDKDKDILFIGETGTKFVGRAICTWGHENRYNDREWLKKMREISDSVHNTDPDVILQGCCFEIVTREVEEVQIPAWAFEALGIPAEDRHFSYEAMKFPEGHHVNIWGDNTCAPDIRQTETQLWYMFLIGNFIEAGCESVHLGQNMLVGGLDKDWQAYDSFLQKVHAYMDPKARRHYVMFDAHAGRRGMFTPDGRNLLDFNAFPLRIQETPENGYLSARLNPDYLDAMFGKYPHPYLVEFDNWGNSDHPGEALDRTKESGFGDEIFVWGYDEISWLYTLPEKERQDWLSYAYKWIAENDPHAHLQMPAARIVSLGHGKWSTARAIAPTENVPDGMNLTETIKTLWNSK